MCNHVQLTTAAGPTAHEDIAHEAVPQRDHTYRLNTSFQWGEGVDEGEGEGECEGEGEGEGEGSGEV